MFRTDPALVLLLAILAVAATLPASASDWPTWRHDAQRTASAPDPLADELHLQWLLEAPPLEPAWLDEHRMRFDACYEPVVVGQRVFVNSPRDDSVFALDSRTGAELWRYRADGPVRFAPLVWEDRVYFACDDGCLYSLAADDGALLWRFQGAPDGRKVLGNKRLISAWPARGAPVIEDGRVYFAAGIWPFMGIFVYCLDARSGEVIWQNDGSGSIYILQPHDSPAFAGVAPQGYLVAAGDSLIVPGGRSVPACFDRATGAFRYFRLHEGQRTGDYRTAAAGDVFYSYSEAHRLDTGESVAGVPGLPVLDAEVASRPIPPSKVLCDLGATWRYNDSGEDLGTAWREPDYDDSAWSEGPGELGYGDDDEKTVLSFGDDSDHKHITSYFRLTFELDAIPDDLPLNATVHYDDGVWLYLNGTRLVGAGLPEDADASALAKGHEGKVAVRFADLDKSALRIGKNVLAAEVHQSEADSSDLSFDMRLAFEAVVTDACAYLAADGDVVGGNLVDGVFRDLWTLGAEAEAVWLRAGQRLYASAEGKILAVDPPTPDAEARVVWERDFADTVGNMIAADDRLFVTTTEGRLYCFGPDPAEERTLSGTPPVGPTGEPGATARTVLAEVDDPGAYCFWWGIEDAAAIVEVARRTELTITVIDPDARRVDALRERLAEAGLYGQRVAALVGKPWDFGLPPYAAHLVVVEGSRFGGEERSDAFARALFESLRPYGGKSLLLGNAPWLQAFETTAGRCDLANARLAPQGASLTLTREGALPGAGNWTHSYCDPGNSVVSKDELVRAPLGLLWFGGSSNSRVLPRHGHGPPEQIVDGRLFIEGPNSLRAMDVYTGRVLWDRDLPGVGKPYDNTSHQPGANALGSNYVSAPDAIYVAYEQRCLVLDPATGETLREFVLPPLPGAESPPAFGIMKVWGGLLVVAASPLVFVGEKALGLGENWDGTCSKRLTAIDRHTGEVRWTRDATLSFRHNAIAIGGDRVYAIDKLPDPIVKRIEEAGKTVPASPKLLCLDVRTGETAWERADVAFGSWLGYSAERDVLLQAGRPSRDMLSDERGDRMAVLDAATGEVRWDRPHEYYGPCLIHGDRIITQTININALGHAYDLLTGDPISELSAVTREDAPWTYGRHYGCNTVIGSEHLITFRSAAAGYYDLTVDGGTANIGGYKSSCTSNLIAADGVLNSPDYTRTCTCSYQNQTSLALVHMPDIEMWAFNTAEPSADRVKRLGLNLGAPGDRRDDDGILWLDYPSVGGPSPDVEVTCAPETPRWFRRHSLRVQGDDHPWVAASGALGLESLTIPLGGDLGDRTTYSVTLYFTEPGDAGPGQRIMDVKLNGRVVLRDLDVASETGGPLRVLAKRVDGVEATEQLTVSLRARSGETVLCGVRIEAME